MSKHSAIVIALGKAGIPLGTSKVQYMVAFMKLNTRAAVYRRLGQKLLDEDRGWPGCDKLRSALIKKR